jgi:hypothetical protein
MTVSIEDARAARAERLANVGREIQLVGRPVQGDFDGRLIIIGCLCVQDTPENPCPCKDWIWHIPLSGVLNRSEKERCDVDGEPLITVTVDPSTDIVIERAKRLKARNLDRARRAALRAGPNRPPGVAYAGAPLPPGSGAGFFLGLAFAAGWGIGEIINDTTDIDDDVYDVIETTIDFWKDFFD